MRAFVFMALSALLWSGQAYSFDVCVNKKSGQLRATTTSMCKKNEMLYMLVSMRMDAQGMPMPAPMAATPTPSSNMPVMQETPAGATLNALLADLALAITKGPIALNGQKVPFNGCPSDQLPVRLRDDSFICVRSSNTLVSLVKLFRK